MSRAVSTQSSIHFGTDGWRAVISDDFTFANVRHVAQAIADVVYAKRPLESQEASQAGVAKVEPGLVLTAPLVVIGYDTRFLSDRYAIAVAEVLAGNGLRVRLSRTFCPTPALSYAVRAMNADAGVMITASHNPPRYNGIKLKASYGGSASAADIRRVEGQLNTNLAEGCLPQIYDYEAGLADGIIERVNLLPLYFDHVRQLVDLAAIGDANLQVVVDPMYGAGRGYLRTILIAAGCDVHEIRGELNPGFGGIYPEPIERNLAALVAAVRDGRADAGLATDGDADRVGALDAAGRFVDPHTIFSLVLRHLVEARGLRGAVVKTISTTQMLNRLARRYDLPLHETPVGFNYIADRMLVNDVLIGGEESGGISIKGHIPEGDGILMGLLLLEVMARAGRPGRARSLAEIVQNLQADVGPFYYARNDVHASVPFIKGELVERLSASAPAQLAGIPVAAINNNDGVKYLLADDSWLLIRPSGTEPILRIYAEAHTLEHVSQLLREGAALAGV
jgi:alpha-D-glucose phosphate-specific phosphoglucomutase